MGMKCGGAGLRYAGCTYAGRTGAAVGRGQSAWEPTPRSVTFLPFRNASMSPVSRGISFHESLFYSLYRLVDAAAIVLAVRVALAQTSGAGLPEWLAVSAGTIIVYHIVSEVSGLYHSWRGT